VTSNKGLQKGGAECRKPRLTAYCEAAQIQRNARSAPLIRRIRPDVKVWAYHWDDGFAETRRQITQQAIDGDSVARTLDCRAHAIGEIAGVRVMQRKMLTRDCGNVGPSIMAVNGSMVMGLVRMRAMKMKMRSACLRSRQFRSGSKVRMQSAQNLGGQNHRNQDQRYKKTHSFSSSESIDFIIIAFCRPLDNALLN
jgi:hypothetical protein